jgi:hypothetical protein
LKRSNAHERNWTRFWPTITGTGPENANCTSRQLGATHYRKRWKIERLFAELRNFRCVIRWEFHSNNYVAWGRVKRRARVHLMPLLCALTRREGNMVEAADLALVTEHTSAQ